MANRTVQTPGFQIKITNISGQILHTGLVKLNPGEERTVPAKYLIDSYNLADDLGQLVEDQKVTAVLNDPVLGYNNIPLNGTYLRYLTTPMPLPYSLALALPTADVPAATDVPEGFMVLDSTTGVLSINVAGTYKTVTLV